MQYSTMLDIVGETRDTQDLVLLCEHAYIISCIILKVHPAVQGQGMLGEREFSSEESWYMGSKGVPRQVCCEKGQYSNNK